MIEKRWLDEGDAPRGVQALLRAASPPRALDPGVRARSRRRLGAIAAVPAAAGAFFWLQHAALGAVLGACVTTSMVAVRAILSEPAPPTAALRAPQSSGEATGARSPGPRPPAEVENPPLVPRPEVPSLAFPSPRAERAPSPAGAGRAPVEADEPAVVREARLLERARSFLASRPASALRALEEHAREFANGTLALERELLAVDALMRLGRRSEAEARGRALRGRAPGSLYSERLEQILGRERGPQ
jgi:hypothetical protein